MQNRTKNLFHIVFLFALIGITFFVLLKDQNLDEINVVLHSVSKPFVFVAACFGLSRIYGEAVSIRMIMKSLGEKATFMQCIHYACVGFLFSGITPSASGGQPAQLLYMNKDRHSLANASLCLVLLTVVWRATILVFGIGIVILSELEIYRNLGKVKLLFWFGMGCNTFLCLAFILVLFAAPFAGRAVCAVIKKLGKWHILKRPDETKENALKILAQYRKGADYIKGHVSLVLKLFFVNLVQRCFMFLVPYFIFLACGLKGGAETALKIMLLQSIVSICADMLPLPGGVYANEKCYIIIMEPVMTGMFVLPSMLLSRGISFYFLILLCMAFVIVMEIKEAVRVRTK